MVLCFYRLEKINGKSRKIILAIIALVALVSMGIFLLMWQNQTEGATALVSIDGEQIMELKLEQEENRPFRIWGRGCAGNQGPSDPVFILGLSRPSVHGLWMDRP